jgi:GTPase SAR1 family protein
MHVANLDPAAEEFAYDAAFDIRDLVSIDETMEELGYGPNGGLVYCMEFLLQNSDWLKNELDGFGEDDYVILDCPGQVELYSHLPIMHDLAHLLQMWGYRVVSVYLLDALFVFEPSKFISGCLLSLSCMMQLALPHVNVITKCDLADKEHIERILDSEGAWMINALDRQTSGKLRNLTEALSTVVDDYMIVSFAMLVRESLDKKKFF